MCSASGLTPAQGASPSCGWPPIVAARDRARRSGRAGVSPSTQEPDLRIGGRGRACRRRRVRPVRQEVAVVHQSWLLSHVRGINGRVRCSDLRERWKSTVVGRGHADGGIRLENYTQKIPGRMQWLMATGLLLAGPGWLLTPGRRMRVDHRAHPPFSRLWRYP